MQYRITKDKLLEVMRGWNDFLHRKVHLIACGGTALTLLDIKPSTKDIDLIVPEVSEYNYLIKVLKQLGYKPVTGSGWWREGNFIFELFRGKMVHTTELLESPLETSKHMLVKEFSYIYLGVLNYYDIIITKLFRSYTVDIEDCIALIKAKREEIVIDFLKERFLETASYDVSEDKVKKHLEHFFEILKEEEIL